MDGSARRKAVVSRYGVPVLTLRSADTGTTIPTGPLKTLFDAERAAMLNVSGHGRVEVVGEDGAVLRVVTFTAQG